MLAGAARTCRYNWEAVAAELRSQVRDDARYRARGDGRLGSWAPKPQLVTAEQVRLRWAAVDREMCAGRRK